MKIYPYMVGPIQTNCYLLLDEESGHAALIDPGEDAPILIDAVHQHAKVLDCILLTHGHYDHSTAVPAVHREFPEAKIHMHRADAKGSRMFPVSPEQEGLSFLGDGDTVKVGSLTVHVLHTPGHTKGGLSFVADSTIFAGDTLFARSCGRTDLEDGSMTDMQASLRRLHDLPGDFRVLPGHMEETTLDEEHRWNPFMRQAVKEAGR